MAFRFDKIPFNRFCKVLLACELRFPPTKPLKLFSHLIVKYSCNGLCACVRVSVKKFFSHTRAWNDIRFTLVHEMWIHYKLSLFSKCLSWSSLFLPFFFSLYVQLRFSFRFIFFFHLNTFIFNSFFSCSSSTVSCRSLAVECSFATIFFWVKVCVFFALCIIHFEHSPCDFCFTFSTRTHFTKTIAISF